MVSFGPSKWNDSRWAQLLAISTVRCFRNVAKLVTKSWIAKLSWWNVTLLPTFTIGVSFIFAQQPELCTRSVSESILLAYEPFIQPDKHHLFADIASLFAHFTELQSDIAELLSQLFVFAIVAVV